MNSNIIKNSLSSSESDKLINLLCPSELYTGVELSGKCIGYKKYLKITGTDPEPEQEVTIDADGEIYNIPFLLFGFTNTAGFKCGDCIYVNNADKKVYYEKNLYEISLNTILKQISINNIYDTHSTFQINTVQALTDNAKKIGISNLYCKDINTLKHSSSSIYTSGIVGTDYSGFIYIKLEANDERYFYNGERITDIQTFRNWAEENDIKILFERANPIVEDITDTYIGRLLLDIKPKKDFVWNISGGTAELCVHCNIDDVLTQIKAMILE
ncbi:MAG: hypothetical protein E7396_00885 [Ruminococcaceae bacterium]|nr:hypothetical protein [Oscillospiraceae bacterium]